MLRNGLHNPFVLPLLGADDLENSLISCCVLDRVYRPVAWQHIDQICYNIYNNEPWSLEAFIHEL
jgi:hypothetical protein